MTVVFTILNRGGFIPVHTPLYEKFTLFQEKHFQDWVQVLLIGQPQNRGSGLF